MTNYLRLYWTDLTNETKERVRVFVRHRIKKDKKRVKSLRQMARDMKKESNLRFADRFDLVLEEEVEDEIEQKFKAKAEI